MSKKEKEMKTGAGSLLLFRGWCFSQSLQQLIFKILQETCSLLAVPPRLPAARGLRGLGGVLQERPSGEPAQHLSPLLGPAAPAHDSGIQLHSVSLPVLLTVACTENIEHVASWASAAHRGELSAPRLAPGAPLALQMGRGGHRSWGVCGSQACRGEGQILLVDLSLFLVLIKMYFVANEDRLPGPVGTSVLIGIPLAIRFLHGCRWDEGQKVLKGVDAVPVWVGEGGAAELRLVNGGSRCAGRVEVEHEGQWGTVCGHNWDLKDAAVVCKQLGCGSAVQAFRYARFGPGTGPIWLATVQCRGSESALSRCRHRGWGDNDCVHGWDAGVSCSGFRLVNGSTACEGRVELHVQGTWGSLCASRWHLSDAHVLCGHLGCGFAVSLPRGGSFGRGTGPIWRDSFHCSGTEAHLGQCPVTVLGASPCSHEDAAAVICSGSRRVRLANGPGRCAGRVEIYSQGSWGSVCDDGWDLPDAAVVCRQLGCGGAVRAPGSAAFGEGSGHIWLDGVNCSGAEAALWDCPAGPWGRHDCGHKEDAGAVCSEFTALRLENSDGCSGRLQVLYNGTWGSVCSNSMTPKTVSLACEELGCGKEGTLEIQWPRGRVSGPAWLDRVECEERHGSFWLCPSAPWNPRSCDELRDQPLCQAAQGGTRPKMTPTPGSACPNATSCTDRERIRAVGGEDGCSGRVELWHRGSWGTVCDDVWDVRDAEVACRQLGCGPAVATLPEAAFGEGTGPVWLEKVECLGTEAALQHCRAWPGDRGLCRHKEDAAVRCAAASVGLDVLQLLPGQALQPPGALLDLGVLVGKLNMSQQRALVGKKADDILGASGRESHSGPPDQQQKRLVARHHVHDPGSPFLPAAGPPGLESAQRQG
ncbi:scavenger receptor cysteine-rich type 1 protein M130-like [Colius striatus]|uniref:scavenger receptor cysteine-rich type 1 protein M130-like n=1 Tax=Colius striatus TaxID=57412 RepID=UPI002B1D50D0|nr:scavenger receptor cysteine-rich type 1 protein M130-like [Colius striatus]